jgi:aminomethyltransferase
MTIPPSATLRHTPLFDRHRELGAKTADFGGWEMPIEYGGVLAEHASVRESVGVFDVSHLGKATVRGPGAAAFVDSCLTGDLARIGPGQAQYTLCCDDASGGVVDDLIVYLYGDDDVLLVPNAANTAEVVSRLAAAAPSGVEVTNRHDGYGVLAVQGPGSAEVLTRLGLPAGLEYMAFTVAEWHGRPLVVCRTGYTGEHGYELLPAWDDTAALWDAITGLGVRPCGLGARDTLRTEMGYPLHGHELSLDITPVQARAGWAVGWDKPAFWGREVLRQEREAGPARRLWGLVSRDRGIPRAGMAVLGTDDVPIGTVTSGTFSPTRRVGIGLALLGAGAAAGDEVVVDVRGRRSAAEVVVPPFVPSSVR